MFVNLQIKTARVFINAENLNALPSSIWNALLRFMHTQRTFFLQNPRIGMLVKTFDKMPAAKQLLHLKTATGFLDGL